MYKKSVMNYPVVFLLMAVFLITGCLNRDNPYDPENPDFVMPEFSCVVCLRDKLTLKKVGNASIIYTYKQISDTIDIDTSGNAFIRINENVSENKIVINVKAINSATHILSHSFYLTLSKEGRDTTILLEDRSPRAVQWDTLGTFSDSNLVNLTWFASNADQFSFYRLIRYNLLTKKNDTIAVITERKDTLYIDNGRMENEEYSYRIDVVSTGNLVSAGNELHITMPNQPPASSKIKSVKGDFFIQLRLLWEKNNDSDFSHYAIYRSTDSISFDSIYAIYSRNDTNWLDTTIDDVAACYYYYIAIVDKFNARSLSNIESGINRVTVEQDLVYIHEGSFTMGRNGTGVPLNEQPQREITLSSFAIDRYEVTVERYVQFLNNGNADRYHNNMEYIGIHRDGTSFSLDSAWKYHPVVWISWSDADTFCRWAGGQLPSEAQWEKSARGNDKRLYPWGNDPYLGNSAPVYYRANYVVGFIDVDDSGYTFDGAKYSAPVGNYASGVSFYGLSDMAGNVSEWCNDWYSNNTVQKSETSGFGLRRSYRGGSFKNYLEELTATYRYSLDPTVRKDDLGCRCAYNADKFKTQNN